MKKLFIIVISLLFASTAFAQVKCVSCDTDFEMTYKRSFVSNNAVIVDFLITYHGQGTAAYGKNRTSIKVTQGANTCIYDDEGNIYKGYMTVEGDPTNIIANVGNSGTCYAELESGIPVKLRITVKDVDEYATSFVKMNLYCTFGYGDGSGIISATNIPIPRN